MSVTRCHWAGEDPIYIAYHDHEWGKPVFDDALLFEFLLLESFQAGLSWITILKRRAGFQICFDDFDYYKIAQYSEDKMEELRHDQRIIRNRLKIKAAVTNAQKFIEVQQQYGSFSDYLWAFVDGKPIMNHPKSMADVPATTPLSDKISKDLKKRGFTFVGSTIIYALMQATGMVNDHIEDCVSKYDSVSNTE